MTNKQIAEKWYKRLGFPGEMDGAFKRALEGAEIPEGLSAESAPTLVGLGTASAVWALYFVENMESEYKKRGLESRFDSDLERLRRRIIGCFDRTGDLDIGDLTWERHYLMAREFRLGRLTFTLGKSPTDIPEKDLWTGDNVLQVHIHGSEPLCFEDCKRSISDAKKFVALHFPDFKYRYFTCLSWLLDDSIADLLGEGSNILKFGTLFEKVRTNKSDNIIRFVFGNGATRETLADIEPKNRFQRELKEAALVGRDFFDVRGVIDSTKI